MKKYWLFGVMVWLLMQYSIVQAQTLTHPAQQQLQQNVDAILSVVHQNNLTEAQKVNQIEGYANQYLDYERISALAVGLPWRQFTVKQQQDFIEAFKTMIIRIYAHSALLGASKAKVSVLPKIIQHNPRQLETFTDIMGSNGQHFEVSYQMYNQNGFYRIYNIRVNGASLVTIYRNQFNTLIQQQGIDGAIETIRQKGLKQNNQLK